MQTYKYLVGSLFLISSLLACGSKTKKVEREAQGAASGVQFKCVQLEGTTEEDIFRYVVYLADGEHAHAIMMAPACSLLDASAYAEHQVPAEAIAAVSSWRAGSGDYLYAIETEAGTLFRRAIVDEMQLVTDYGYMDWALWQGDSLITYEDFRLMPISGLYIAGNHETSYLLLLDKVKGQWQARGLELEGMLPPREDLRMELDKLSLQRIPDFEFEPESGRFSAGKWGKGQLVTEKGGRYLVFEDKEDGAGEPLRMGLSMR